MLSVASISHIMNVTLLCSHACCFAWAWKSSFVNHNKKDSNDLSGALSTENIEILGNLDICELGTFVVYTLCIEKICCCCCCWMIRLVCVVGMVGFSISFSFPPCHLPSSLHDVSENQKSNLSAFLIHHCHYNKQMIIPV